MKYLLLLLSLFTSLTAIRGQAFVDTAKYAILRHDNSNDRWVFNKNCTPYSLTGNDIVDLETILSKCITEYNKAQKTEYNRLRKKYPKEEISITQFAIDLTKYKRQIIAVLNAKGQIEVWINCFRPFTNFNFSNWRQKIVQVDDGGNYFFNVKINLTSKKYHDLMINGLA